MLISIVLFFCSCTENFPTGYDLPAECDSKCEFVSDMNSFRDAAANSAAQFSNCICIEKGLVPGVVTVLKPLRIIGKNDGSSRLEKLAVKNVRDVFISDIVFSNGAVENSALLISESSVTLKNITFSDISAGSLSGGRGIVVTGGRSEVNMENVHIRNTDGTGLLINGAHTVNVHKSSFSDCGFAGIWVQNSQSGKGEVGISDTQFENNGAVSLQMLGKNTLKINDSEISGVLKRELNMEVVGDGIVIKNSIMDQTGSVMINNLNITGYFRAAMIFDGENGAVLSGIAMNNVDLASKTGQFGVVVQNGDEFKELRNGIEDNPYLENDLERTDPLFILDAAQETD